MEITIGQQYDPEIWETVKEHFNQEELDLAVIEEHPDGEALLIWTFKLHKDDARRLAVMLEMVAGLGNPQTGLDMKPSKRELWS